MQTCLRVGLLLLPPTITITTPPLKKKVGSRAAENGKTPPTAQQGALIKPLINRGVGQTSLTPFCQIVSFVFLTNYKV